MSVHCVYNTFGILYLKVELRKESSKNAYCICRVDQEFRLNLGKSNKMIIFMSLLATFNKINYFRSGSVIGLGIKPNHYGKVKLVQIFNIGLCIVLVYM